MGDLGALTHAHFEACLNQAFQVQCEAGGAVSLELITVETRGPVDPERARRAGFSLIFRGPAEPLLPQRIYTVRNAALGTLDIFLVPIGQGRDGLRYEAVFS